MLLERQRAAKARFPSHGTAERHNAVKRERGYLTLLLVKLVTLTVDIH